MELMTKRAFRYFRDFMLGLALFGTILLLTGCLPTDGLGSGSQYINDPHLEKQILDIVETFLQADVNKSVANYRSTVGSYIIVDMPYLEGTFWDIDSFVYSATTRWPDHFWYEHAIYNPRVSLTSTSATIFADYSAIIANTNTDQVAQFKNRIYVRLFWQKESNEWRITEFSRLRFW